MLAGNTWGKRRGNDESHAQLEGSYKRKAGCLGESFFLYK